jgi:hypothetical protein
MCPFFLENDKIEDFWIPSNITSSEQFDRRIITIFTTYFFKSVHTLVTLLLRPTPYLCTQKYAFGGTRTHTHTAYVLYGWPHKVNPSSRLIWNLFVEVSPELHVKNIQTVSTTKTRYALALMQCWFKFYSSDGPKFGQFIYRWNYLVALVESRGLGPIWEHVLCQSAFYSLFCKPLSSRKLLGIAYDY